jgi:hypothetical protein
MVDGAWSLPGWIWRAKAALLIPEGRLPAFAVPVGEDKPYRGAPHMNHEQNEWLHTIACEFVAADASVKRRELLELALLHVLFELSRLYFPPTTTWAQSHNRSPL